MTETVTGKEDRTLYLTEKQYLNLEQLVRELKCGSADGMKTCRAVIEMFESHEFRSDMGGPKFLEDIDEVLAILKKWEAENSPPVAEEDFKLSVIDDVEKLRRGQIAIECYGKFADGIELDEAEADYLKSHLNSLANYFENFLDRYTEDDLVTLKALRRFVDGFELTDAETDILKNYLRRVHDACQTSPPVTEDVPVKS